MKIRNPNVRNSKYSRFLILFFLNLSFVICHLSFALTLDESVKLTLKSNPDLIAAKKRWEAASAKIPQTLSLENPKFSLEYEQIPSGSRNPEEGMKMYKAEQTIMFPGKIAAEYLMAGREAEMFKALYQAKHFEVLSNVKSAYYDLYLTDRSIEVMQELQGYLANIKKSAEAKYIVGQVIQTEVLQANIEYLLVSNELLTINQERIVREAKLKAMLNLQNESTIEVVGDYNFPATIESISVLEKSALQKRPEILAMKAELGMKGYADFKSKMEYFPDIMLGVRKRVTDGWDAMIGFSLPLYFWKQGYGIASSSAEKAAAEAVLNNMKNMTIWEVKEAYVMVDAAQRTTRLYEASIVPQSRQAIKVALAAYPSGKIDFQFLLQTAKMYKETKLKYYENQVNYGKALAQLERIIGGELK